MFVIDVAFKLLKLRKVFFGPSTVTYTIFNTDISARKEEQGEKAYCQTLLSHYLEEMLSGNSLVPLEALYPN